MMSDQQASRYPDPLDKGNKFMVLLRKFMEFGHVNLGRKLRVLSPCVGLLT